jgi:hypothetical protein
MTVEECAPAQRLDPTITGLRTRHRLIEAKRAVGICGADMKYQCRQPAIGR